jgi:hypothetical protein
LRSRSGNSILRALVPPDNLLDLITKYYAIGRLAKGGHESDQKIRSHHNVFGGDSLSLLRAVEDATSVRFGNPPNLEEQVWKFDHRP